MQSNRDEVEIRGGPTVSGGSDYYFNFKFTLDQNYIGIWHFVNPFTMIPELTRSPRNVT